MDKKELDRIEREIEANGFRMRDLEQLPSHIYEELSQRRADCEYAKLRSEVDFASRNWTKGLETFIIGGLMGEAIYCIPHLILSRGEKAVIIVGRTLDHSAPFEVFKTREKLDSFIAALNEMWDKLEQEGAQ